MHQESNHHRGKSKQPQANHPCDIPCCFQEGFPFGPEGSSKAKGWKAGMEKLTQCVAALGNGGYCSHGAGDELVPMC